MARPAGKEDALLDHWAATQPLIGDAGWIEATDDGAHEFKLSLPHRHRMRVGLGSVPPAEITRTVFYGNTIADQHEFMGLAEYFNTLNPKQAQNAVNVINGGARGRDSTSIYLIRWDPAAMCLAYSPKGLLDADGRAQVALIPVDWRFAVRVCNIDVMKGDCDITCALDKAVVQIPHFRSGRAFFYMNVEAHNLCRAQSGTDACAYREIPIRIVNELRNDEPLVN